MTDRAYGTLAGSPTVAETPGIAKRSVLLG